MKKEFKVANGAQFSKKKAQVYGECLDKISQSKGGRLLPIDVIEEASKKNSPIHNYFDWDNSSAAAKYRIEQARHLINHITVVIKYDHGQKEQKAFFSVNENPFGKTKNKSYIPVEIVMAEPNLKNQVLQEAIDEVVYWEKQYKEYRELSRIFSAIDITKKKIYAKINRKGK